MGQQSDTLDNLYEELKHLKMLLEKCAELSALVAGDLTSIPTTPNGCISVRAISQHKFRMDMDGERGDLAKLTREIAALGRKIEKAKEAALYTTTRLNARLRSQE